MSAPDEPTVQQRIKSVLERSGLPYRKIDVYGSQIVVTTTCEASAKKWGSLIRKFAKLRGIVKSVDDVPTSKRRFKVLHPVITVWRTFGVIQ